MTVRSLADAICGIFGNVGELYLGDGNEKNCCSISEVIISYSETFSSVTAIECPLLDIALPH